MSGVEVSEEWTENAETREVVSLYELRASAFVVGEYSDCFLVSTSGKMFEMSRENWGDGNFGGGFDGGGVCAGGAYG